MKKILKITTVLVVLIFMGMVSSDTYADTIREETHNDLKFIYNDDTKELEVVCNEEELNLYDVYTYIGKSKKLVLSGDFTYLEGMNDDGIRIFESVEEFEINASVTEFSAYVLSAFKKIKKFTIPNTVKKIQHSCFEGCSSLTEVIFPESIDYVDCRCMFKNCSALENIRFPKTISQMAYTTEDMFYNCSSLKKIEISGLEVISDDTFRGCTSLEYIDINSLPTIKSKAFTGAPNLKLVVLDGINNFYPQINKPINMKVSYPINDYYSLDQYETNKKYLATCGENAYWTYNHATKTLRVSGTGKMDDFSGTKLWDYLKDKVENVEIDYSISYVGNNFIKGYSNLKNVYVKNPNTVIAKSAFTNCNANIVTGTNDVYKSEINLEVKESVDDLISDYYSGSLISAKDTALKKDNYVIRVYDNGWRKSNCILSDSIFKLVYEVQLNKGTIIDTNTKWLVNGKESNKLTVQVLGEDTIIINYEYEKTPESYLGIAGLLLSDFSEDTSFDIIRKNSFLFTDDEERYKQDYENYKDLLNNVNTDTITWVKDKKKIILNNYNGSSLAITNTFWDKNDKEVEINIRGNNTIKVLNGGIDFTNCNLRFTGKGKLNIIDDNRVDDGKYYRTEVIKGNGSIVIDGPSINIKTFSSKAIYVDSFRTKNKNKLEIINGSLDISMPVYERSGVKRISTAIDVDETIVYNGKINITMGKLDNPKYYPATMITGDLYTIENGVSCNIPDNASTKITSVNCVNLTKGQIVVPFDIIGTRLRSEDVERYDIDDDGYKDIEWSSFGRELVLIKKLPTTNIKYYGKINTLNNPLNFLFNTKKHEHVLEKITDKNSPYYGYDYCDRCDQYFYGDGSVIKRNDGKKDNNKNNSGVNNASPSVFTVAKIKYRVIGKTNTVSIVKCLNKKAKTIKLKNSVTYKNKTYKIVSIDKAAFSKLKKLKKITVSKLVTSIGAKVFYKCKKLKRITIKATKLKKVGKNAFKSINKSAKINVPKKCFKKYKKLLQKKGQKKTVKIVK